MKCKFWCFLFVMLLAGAAFSGDKGDDRQSKRDVPSIKSSVHKEKKQPVKASEKKGVMKEREFKAKISSMAKPIKKSGSNEQNGESKK